MLKALLLLLQVAQNYLLVPPLQDALQHGRYEALAAISRPRLVLNLEEPVALRGAMSREQFVAEFAARFAPLQAEKIEWLSLQAEEDNAVQSLNLILRRRLSGARIYYKLIFFMSGETVPGREKTWKLYYVRGLKI